MLKNVNTYTFDWLPQNYTFNQDTSFDFAYRAEFFKKSPYLGGAFIINNNDVLLKFCTQ